MSSVLAIEKLTKYYDDFYLDEVTFALPEGFIMGLIGPNGAGKTTIIKAIMNLVMKNSGSIKVFGKDHREYEIEIKERIGFVYDNPNYYDHLTLKRIKNIIAPFYKKWDEAKFIELVDLFNLPLNKVLKKFSRGMVMKSAIAIALSHNADLIIMDEPTSGLDPVFRRELLNLLYELLQNEKKSILFSTHITSDLEKIADYITFINEGKIIFSESKDDILSRYGIVKGGKEVLNEETREFLRGYRTSDVGFEALTDNVPESERKFGSDVIIEKATLEDIMYFNNQK